jgi:hypothetical protein
MRGGHRCYLIVIDLFAPCTFAGYQEFTKP